MHKLLRKFTQQLNFNFTGAFFSWEWRDHLCSFLGTWYFKLFLVVYWNNRSWIILHVHNLRLYCFLRWGSRLIFSVWLKVPLVVPVSYIILDMSVHRCTFYELFYVFGKAIWQAEMSENVSRYYKLLFILNSKPLAVYSPFHSCTISHFELRLSQQVFIPLRVQNGWVQLGPPATSYNTSNLGALDYKSSA